MTHKIYVVQYCEIVKKVEIYISSRLFNHDIFDQTFDALPKTKLNWFLYEC